MKKITKLREIRDYFSNNLGISGDDYCGILQVLDEDIKREETDENGLKPCPFCGGKAFITPEGDYHEVCCEKCGVYMDSHTFDGVAYEWNRRA